MLWVPYDSCNYNTAIKGKRAAGLGSSKSEVKLPLTSASEDFTQIAIAFILVAVQDLLIVSAVSPHI